MRLVDQHWLDNCTASGLSSGEGLITAVRDRSVTLGKGGKPDTIDEGIPDKRLLVVEGEFAQCLRVLAREGNTLSSIMRNLWDTGRDGTMTKTPLKTTDAHVSLIGHITADELRGYLSHTEMFNGFANRFLWLLVKRSKTLPDGGAYLDLDSFREPLEMTLAHARTVTLMKRTDAAGRLWRDRYEHLTADRCGLFGAVTSRADAQTLRLSMIYALADGCAVIDEKHLRAALALWDYAEQSARIIFGEEPEAPLVGKVYGLLNAEPNGMTKTDLHKALGNNHKAKTILEALATLRERFGGVRVPSELVGLCWEDIDRAQGRFLVRSPKKKDTRSVPLYPELAAYLPDVFGEGRIFPDVREDSNLGERLSNTIARAGVEQWPRLWQNMRASRQTELSAIYPATDVCAWMGNTQAVAADHYLSTLDASFARAAKCGASALQEALHSALHNALPTTTDQERLRLTESEQPLDSVGVSRILSAVVATCRSAHVPPRGIEPLS